MPVIFLLLIVMPILEISLILEVKELIGGWNTIGLVILTALVGGSLLKQQGMATLQRFQLRVQQGDIPGQELVEGMLLLVGGALLLTPGFVTDGIGLALLLPFSRAWMANAILRAGIIKGGAFGGSTFQNFQAGSHDAGPQGASYENIQRPQAANRAESAQRSPRPGSGHVIEGEFEHKDD